MTRIDIAIIGSGPAGLEAALTAKNRNKSIMVFGSKDLSPKMVSIEHPITNYLGLSNVTGRQMAEAFTKQMEEAGIEISEQRITAVYAMGDFFGLQTSDNQMLEASAVILCTGVTAGNPYPGETQFLGRGVSYCATCDAFLYKGKSAVVVGYTRQAEAEAEFLAETAEKVYYVPMYKGKDKDIVPELAHGIEVVMDKATGIEKNEAEAGSSAMKLLLENGEIQAHGIFVLRESTAVDVLVPGLAVDEAGKHVMVDRSMATNIPGCFAPGDLTGRPYQYIKAAGEGNVAALSAVAYLDTNK